MRKSLLLALAVAGCSSEGALDGDNPFLGDLSDPGKEDSAYMNPDGIEVDFDLDAVRVHVRGVFLARVRQVAEERVIAIEGTLTGATGDGEGEQEGLAHGGPPNSKLHATCKLPDLGHLPPR